MALDMSVSVDDTRAALREAAAHGYWLARRQLDSGEHVFTWLPHRADTPPPVFARLEEAIDYMARGPGG
jgi:hypothetical protein